MKYIDENYKNPNRRIHIGFIHRCNKGEKFGLLYGFRQQLERSRDFYNSVLLENKIFYFEKVTDLYIAQDSLVTYLSYDYNGFTPKVEYVYPVSSLIINDDKRGTMRADGTNHDDDTWKLINEGLPYIDYQRCRSYVVYYPLIKGDYCSIYKGLWGVGIYMNKEAEIFEMYHELCTINYKGWPTLEEATDAIKKISHHIDSIDISRIIDTYEIKKKCVYVQNVGKDYDSYFIDKVQKLNSNDEYLLYLLPNKIERIEYDDEACPRSNYFIGDIFLEEETLQAILKAKSEYTKEKHLAYLISEYFYEILQKKERTEELYKLIKNEFDLDNASKVASNFYGEITDDFINIINQYNESTLKGELFFHSPNSKINIETKKRTTHPQRNFCPSELKIDLDALNLLTRPKRH